MITPQEEAASFLTWIEDVADRGSIMVASCLLMLFEFHDNLRGKE